MCEVAGIESVLIARNIFNDIKNLKDKDSLNRNSRLDMLMRLII